MEVMATEKAKQGHEPPADRQAARIQGPARQPLLGT